MKPKNMGDVSALLNEHKNPDVELTEDEKRLIDLLTFEKTGKRLPEFKEREEAKAKKNNIVILEAPEVNTDKLQRIEIGPTVSMQKLDLENGSKVKTLLK